jgi:hypothetical protein
MQYSILTSKFYPQIPSASGAEYYHDRLFVMGDDTNYFFILNKEGEVLEKILLFESPYTGRIPKKEKPDLEAMCIVERKGEKYFLLLGSGSRKKNRDDYFLVKTTDYQRIKRKSLGDFYDLLREDKRLTEVNIEAAETIENEIILFNRGGMAQPNFMILTENLLSENPEYELFKIEIPEIQGIPAGISGAAYIKEWDILLISASGEITSNAIDDGTIVGSLIGIMRNFSKKRAKKTFFLDEYAILTEIPTQKIESLCVTKVKGNAAELVAVSDNDDGTSTIFWVEVKV